jgi:hypothetical protein
MNYEKNDQFPCNILNANFIMENGYLLYAINNRTILLDCTVCTCIKAMNAQFISDSEGS